ncbi:sugar ABC transporter substrate-binding protein [Enterococcus saccharolyticus]|uniref:ABC transporter substrate-binding protein n=1 Tax=Enterococcus saccharolyticus TaxID=41997 RepID=UPI001E36177B|nr:sugar ABC transporter substrate-binding protein [Enterococcus saccharolyticus]MCD5003681.1 sugar ABC transporter substrate-binding protein [Enterococcus saccharolyticus]
MKKYLGFLAIGLSMVALSLSGCGKQASSDSSKITMFVSGDTAEGNAYSKMAKKYEEETNIKVEVTDVPYADLGTKISKAVQADDAPEVVRVSGIEPDWGSYLMDLSDVAKQAKTLESMTIKDEEDIVRGLPTDVTAVGLFINTDLFDEAGVDYPTSEEDIWTWDEFLDKLKTIQEKTDARYGMVMDASDHRLRAFTYQFGGKDFFLNEGKDGYTTDEATKVALQKFIDLNEDGTMPKSVWTSGEDAASMFKSGLVPAYFSGSWQITDFSENIDSFKWKAVYMPYEETRATNMGGNFLAGFENSKNSEEGKKFIEWLYQPENYQQLCTYAGYLPAVEDMTVTYEHGQDAYEIYQNEIAAAAQPISGKQTNDQVTMTLKGYSGLTGSYKEKMVQVLNKEITLDEMIEAVEKDYDNGFLKK